MKNKMKNISKNLLILLIIIVVLLPNLYSQNNTIKFYQDSLKTDFEIKKKNSRRWLLGTIANLGLTTGFHFLGNNSYSKYEEAKSPSEVEKYWDQTMNYDKAFDISVGTASVMLFQSIRAKVKNQSIQSEMEKIPLQYISTVSEKKNLVCSSSIIDDDSNLILLCNEKKLERKSFNRQKNDNSIFLYKVNMEGQIKWKHHYNTKNYEFGNSIIKTMNSGFLIAGISRFTPIDNFNVLLIKNDSVGNIEWQKTFEITGQSEIMFVEQSNDSVYNIIGKSTTSYRVIHWFLKIDNNGEILNKTEFLVNNIFFDYSIIPIKNGYIIGGSYRIKNRIDSDIIIIRIDNNGNKIWEKIMGNKKYNEEFFDMIYTDDNMLCIWSKRIKNSKLNESILTYLDGSGNLLSEFKSTDNYLANGEKILQFDKKSLFLLGDKLGKIQLFMIDRNCRMNIRDEYVKLDKTQPVNFHKLDDNSLLIIGNSTNTKPKENKINLFRTYRFDD